MLELGDAEREIVDLLAAREPCLCEPSLDRFVPVHTEPLDLGAPRRHRVLDRVAHRTAVDADAARKIVRHVVGGLEPETRPADAGKQEL